MAKAKNGRTLVTFLLDRTGSMESVKKATIEGFNGYVETLQKEKAADIEFTLITFDTQSMDKICVCKPIKGAPKLDEKNYQPRSGTNLIDCAYDTIKAVEGQEKAKGAKIVICFQTDGEENSSHKHTSEELKTLIEEKTKLGWQFNFMGCGIDAYAQSARMGMTYAQTTSYSPDAASTDASFRANAMNTSLYAAGARDNTSYTNVQRAASGDKFYHYQNGLVGNFGLTGTPVKGPIPTQGPLDLNDASKPKDSSLDLNG
jgi:hypothetical protein